jgi:uncharacterized protein YlxW (UPF0749 family)
MENTAAVQSFLMFLFGGGLMALLDWLLKWRTSRHEVKRSEFNQLLLAIDELQQENTRLQQRVADLETENEKMRKQNIEYRQGIQALLNQIIATGGIPVWSPTGTLETPTPAIKRKSHL